MPVADPSIKRFVAEIVHTAAFAVATHNDYIGSFLGKGHRHDNLYQISYVLKGQTRILLGKSRYLASDGDLLLIPPRQWHASGPGEEKKRFNLLQIKFRISRRLPMPFPMYIRLGYAPEIADGFHSIIAEFHMQRPQRETMMRINLAHLLLLVHRRSLLKGTGYHLPSLKDSKFTEKRLGNVIQYIQANYSRELTLPEIAGMSGYSVSAFSHMFTRYAGASPVKYLINYRLSKALDLMANTDRKLDDIASEAGFSSVYYFSRLFRKRYNQSPRRYARLIYNSPK